MSKSKLKKSELIDVIKRNVAKANKRLLNIEKNNLTTASNAYRYLQDKQGRTRFSTKGLKSLKRNELLKYYTTIDNFLSAKTSSVRGIKSAYRKSYNTIKSKYKLKNLSFETYASILETESIESFKSNYGSNQLVTMLGIANKNNVDDIVNIIENSYGKTLKELDSDIDRIPNKNDWTPVEYNEDIFL